MKFGCSECLCIAIESHRPALLKSLLQRSDVVYRDMFWARYPSKWAPYVTGNEWVKSIPQLHHFGSDSDLSFVCREDCGHMRVDDELQTPFDVLCNPNYSTAYILVSLPLMARWHSSVSFNAEHILRQSGQFHYSNAQFYHTQCEPSILRSILPGPLHSTTTWLRCEYESDSEALTLSTASETPLLLLHEPSSLPCDKTFIACLFTDIDDDMCGLHKFYGMLARLVYEMDTSELHFGKQIQRQFRAAFESGADLNLMLPFRYARFSSYPQIREHRFVNLICYDLLYHVFCADPMRNKWSIQQQVFKFLLINGLSYFYLICEYRNPSGIVYPPTSESLLQLLFLAEWNDLPSSLLPLAQAIALQLLALGYGRRELHTDSFPARDPNLFVTRFILFHSHADYNMEARRELQSLIDHFDAGPLTLQQLARIAIRRAVGGADFARQVRRIASHIPPLLFLYVAEPSEHLLTDDEVNQLPVDL